MPCNVNNMSETLALPWCDSPGRRASRLPFEGRPCDDQVRHASAHVQQIVLQMDTQSQGAVSEIRMRLQTALPCMAGRIASLWKPGLHTAQHSDCRAEHGGVMCCSDTGT